MEFGIGTAVLVAMVSVLFYLWRKYRKFSTKLDHLPGPKGHLFFGNALQVNDPTRFHKDFTELSWKSGGPVCKFLLLNHYFVVMTCYDTIREMLLVKGRETAGRYATWRIQYALKNTGILFNRRADETWKRLRKVSHRHLKQFGDGMSRLQDVITEVAEDMMETFRLSQGQPLDPNAAIFDAALITIAVLITGRRYKSEDRLMAQMREYEPHFLVYIISINPVQFLLMDTMPLLRYLMPGAWAKVQSFPDLEDAIWRDIKQEIRDNPDEESLAKLLLSHTDNKEFSSSEEMFSEMDAKRTCMSLLLAGLSTTSHTFYAFVNILAHHKVVQEKMKAETDTCKKDGVTLADRPRMDYSRATIFELLRYFTTIPAGVPHEMQEDATIQGHFIPTGTTVTPLLWGLHHDKSFWGDPENFRPERFLDPEGHLVAADHRNRKHLLPFSAGPRVCIGESMALARLFLWATNLVQRFEVVPAPDSDPSACTADSFFTEGILTCRPYSVIFRARS